MPKTKRCFVLGAGFSKPCGLPLASELTAEVRRYQMLPNNATGLPTFEQHFNDLVSLAFPSRDEANFELLLTRIDELIDFARDYNTAGGLMGPLERWIAMRKNILRRLFLVLDEKSRRPNNEGTEAVDRFVRGLRPDRDVVVSFNWDVLIELACARRTAPIAREPNSPGSLVLLKPHGSIDLLEIPRAELGRRDQRYINRLDLLDEKQGVCTFLVKNCANAANDAIFPWLPHLLVVPPTARKTYESPWIKRQWYHAFNALRDANEITVIGYSLPSFDFRSHVLFRLAALAWAGRPGRIRVFDPDPTRVAEPLGAAGFRDVESVQGSWEDHLAELP